MDRSDPPLRTAAPTRQQPKLAKAKRKGHTLLEGSGKIKNIVSGAPARKRKSIVHKQQIERGDIWARGCRGKKISWHHNTVADWFIDMGSQNVCAIGKAYSRPDCQSRPSDLVRILHKDILNCSAPKSSGVYADLIRFARKVAALDDQP